MLTTDQYKSAAGVIGCDIPTIKAVYEVEALGSGFLKNDDRLKILFEGHRFWKLLAKGGFKPAEILVKYAHAPNDKAKKELEYYGLTPAKVKNVLYERWDRKQYKGGAAEWDRHSAAVAICKLVGASTDLAQMAASYGAFQILGENYDAAGYATVAEMVYDYSKGEAQQLTSFCTFVKSNGLDDELRAKNWAGFAKGYNGTGYKLNAYDTKLAASYRKFSK